VSDPGNPNSNNPRIKDVFADAWVSVMGTATRQFVCLELRGGFQSFRCNIQASRRGLKCCEDVARSFGLPLKITSQALQWMQSDQIRPCESVVASSDPIASDRSSLSQWVTRLRALAKRGPTELAMLDSVANELMRQSLALEDAADMLHECAGECAACDREGTLLSGAVCEACAPVRDAERLARAACTPVMDLEVDARLWEALKAAVIRSPRMRERFEGAGWLEHGITHVITWLDESPRPALSPTDLPRLTLNPASLARLEELPREIRSDRESTLMRQLSRAIAQLREAGLASHAEVHGQILRDAGIEIMDDDCVPDSGPSL
jgi:hypothetical protein